MFSFVQADYDGFYGEPAPFDAELEVEMQIVVEGPVTVRFARGTAPLAPIAAELPPAAAVIMLDDDWFGSFDETAPIVEHDHLRIPTTRWQKLGDWLRALGRAA